MEFNLARTSKYVTGLLAVAGLALLVGCGSGTAAGPAAERTRAPSPTPAVGSAGVSAGGTNILALGEFQLPAADSFGEPGFHEVLRGSHDLPADPPADLDGIAGKRLILRLWDADRPQRNCGSEHPLSGCATVDWSDAPGRPNVPSGGVFNNSITLQFEDGERSFFLSESGALRDQPEAFDPG